MHHEPSQIQYNTVMPANSVNPSSRSSRRTPPVAAPVPVIVVASIAVLPFRRAILGWNDCELNRSGREFSAPLPLAGEVAALEERSGWGLSPLGQCDSRLHPHPALPRKRERERNAIADATRSNLIPF